MQPLRVWQLHPCIASYLMCYVDTCYWLELAAPLFRSFSHLGSAALCESVSYLYHWFVSCYSSWTKMIGVVSGALVFPMFTSHFQCLVPLQDITCLVILHCEAACFQCHRAAAAGERYGVLPSTSKDCDQGSRGFGREWVSLNTLGWDFLLDDFNLKLS